MIYEASENKDYDMEFEYLEKAPVILPVNDGPEK